MPKMLHHPDTTALYQPCYLSAVFPNFYYKIYGWMDEIIIFLIRHDPLVTHIWKNVFKTFFDWMGDQNDIHQIILDQTAWDRFGRKIKKDEWLKLCSTNIIFVPIHIKKFFLTKLSSIMSHRWTKQSRSGSFVIHA